jgi:hypothetical protein
MKVSNMVQKRFYSAAHGQKIRVWLLVVQLTGECILLSYYYTMFYDVLFTRIVHIWDTLTANHAYYLPGHKGSVNDVIFHPNEPIIASCSSDKTIYLGELNE